MKKIKRDGVIVEDTEPEANDDFAEKEEVEEEEITGRKPILNPVGLKESVLIKEVYMGAFVPQMEEILNNDSFKRQFEKRVTGRKDLVDLAFFVSNLHILQYLRDIRNYMREDRIAKRKAGEK